MYFLAQYLGWPLGVAGFLRMWCSLAAVAHTPILLRPYFTLLTQSSLSSEAVAAVARAKKKQASFLLLVNGSVRNQRNVQRWVMEHTLLTLAKCFGSSQTFQSMWYYNQNYFSSIWAKTTWWQWPQTRWSYDEGFLFRMKEVRNKRDKTDVLIFWIFWGWACGMSSCWRQRSKGNDCPRKPQKMTVSLLNLLLLRAQKNLLLHENSTSSRFLPHGGCSMEM